MYVQWRLSVISFETFYSQVFFATTRDSRRSMIHERQRVPQPDRSLVTHRSWQLSINTIYFFHRVVSFEQNEEVGQTDKDRSRVSNANEIELHTRSSPLVYVTVCSQNVAPVCTAKLVDDSAERRTRGRSETGTKFTLADTFVATKSRRLRSGETPPIPNTFGRAVLTQEMRSSCCVISLHRRRCIGRLIRGGRRREPPRLATGLLNSAYALRFDVDTL